MKREWALAALVVIGACAEETASPPLLVRPVPAQYFLIGYAEDHDSARGFGAECVMAGTMVFDRGSLDEYRGIGITAAYLRRMVGPADSSASSGFGDVRLARAGSGGGVRLDLPPLAIVPAALQGSVDRDSSYRGDWPCATLPVPAPPGSGRTDPTYRLLGRWALCPDSATCSLSQPGSGGGGPPVRFYFPEIPTAR